MNSWNKFLQNHRDEGLNIKQLSHLYKQTTEKNAKFTKRMKNASHQYGNGFDININNCFGQPGCVNGNTIEFIIPSGTFFFHGSKSGQPPFLANDGHTEPIQFFNVDFDKTVTSYASYRGKVCVYQSNRDLRLYLQKNLADPTCAIFFMEDDYPTPQAQCFCAHPFDGYATYFKGQLMDIAICSPEHKITYLGYYLASDLNRNVIKFYNTADRQTVEPHSIRYNVPIMWHI